MSERLLLGNVEVPLDVIGRALAQSTYAERAEISRVEREVRESPRANVIRELDQAASERIVELTCGRNEDRQRIHELQCKVADQTETIGILQRKLDVVRKAMLGEG